jgi:ligand-binding SRPBCC domain-containing protein
MIIERQSIIDAPAEKVWARVVTPEGINDELRPWMTMSMPRGAESLTVDNVPIGTPVGRCWMLLFGVIPFDYDRLVIAELRHGRGFDEQSTMLSMRRWRHQRDLTPAGEQTLVSDRLTFELRTLLRFLTPVVAAGIRALFGHRHRRLQRHFAESHAH